jgi:hypothetical protein
VKKTAAKCRKEHKERVSFETSGDERRKKAKIFSGVNASVLSTGGTAISSFFPFFLSFVAVRFSLPSSIMLHTFN